MQNHFGKVIASAGPEAIPEENRATAKKLGPFLKRVCKENHILYAPVAEELGKDLQDQGMKHSSLALPFEQNGNVSLVLCIMADEGERIPPYDAAVLEILSRELNLEILSSASQHIAEEKNEKLLSLIRQKDSIAVEHLDPWGHLEYNRNEEERFLVGLKIELPGYVGPGLHKARSEFLKEARAIFLGYAEAFEFLPREWREDFWILSPKGFQNSFLRSMGPAKSCLVLSVALDRQIRSLSAREGYLLLAQPQSKIAAGKIRLRWDSRGTHPSGGKEPDPVDNQILHEIREKSISSSPAFWDPTGATDLTELDCRSFKRQIGASHFYHSILQVSADKRELRKLETLALDFAKSSLKKVA